MAFNHQYISLSSSLLLRISPYTFAFIPILPMSLSSLNRSIYAVSRHILPYVAPLCKVLHYSKTRVPWQLNNTFIISIFPRFSLIYQYLQSFFISVLFIKTWHNLAYLSIFLLAKVVKKVENL